MTEGRLPKDYFVECSLIVKEEALAMSLAENSGHEAMYPSDVVTAYRNLIDAGLSPDEIAPRFGSLPGQ